MTRAKSDSEATDIGEPFQAMLSDDELLSAKYPGIEDRGSELNRAFHPRVIVDDPLLFIRGHHVGLCHSPYERRLK